MFSVLLISAFDATTAGRPTDFLSEAAFRQLRARPATPALPPPASQLLPPNIQFTAPQSLLQTPSDPPLLRVLPTSLPAPSQDAVQDHHDSRSRRDHHDSRSRHDHHDSRDSTSYRPPEDTQERVRRDRGRPRGTGALLNVTASVTDPANAWISTTGVLSAAATTTATTARPARAARPTIAIEHDPSSPAQPTAGRAVSDSTGVPGR